MALTLPEIIKPFGYDPPEVKNNTIVAIRTGDKLTTIKKCYKDIVYDENNGEISVLVLEPTVDLVVK